MSKPIAVIIGVGSGLSASLARQLAPDYDLILAARTTDKMPALAAETSAQTIVMDASNPAAMAALFEGLPRRRAWRFTIHLRGCAVHWWT